MRRAWRDQIAVWIGVGSGGLGGSRRSGAGDTGWWSGCSRCLHRLSRRLVPKGDSRVRCGSQNSHSLPVLVAPPQLPPSLAAPDRAHRLRPASAPAEDACSAGRRGSTARSSRPTSRCCCAWRCSKARSRWSRDGPSSRPGPRTSPGAPVVSGPPRPMARVEALKIPGPAGEIGARFYVALGAPRPPQPLLVYLPRRRLGDRRPRHPRRPLPLPRRVQRLPGALGRLPAGARAPLPGTGRRRLRRLRLGRRAGRRARHRPGADRGRRRQRRRQPLRRGLPAGA